VTQASDILAELQRRGVSVVADGNILCLKPRRALDEDLMARIRNMKPAILEALRSRPATCGSTCYEIERGRWIHHPWDGCKTPVSPKTVNPAMQAECKHCGGAGECSCTACTLRRTEKAAPCLMCQPHKRQVWLAATRPEKRESATIPS
jgi:hypothetical protein